MYAVTGHRSTLFCKLLKDEIPFKCIRYTPDHEKITSKLFCHCASNTILQTKPCQLEPGH